MVKFANNKVDRRNYPDWEMPSTLDFAEEFFNLSWDEVKALPKDKLDALIELKGYFMDFSDDVLERIMDDGFGESFDEMYEQSGGKPLMPKLAREFFIELFGFLEIITSIDFADKIRNDAYTAKYGNLWNEL